MIEIASLITIENLTKLYNLYNSLYQQAECEIKDITSTYDQIKTIHEELEKKLQEEINSHNTSTILSNGEEIKEKEIEKIKEIINLVGKHTNNYKTESYFKVVKKYFETEDQEKLSPLEETWIKIKVHFWAFFEERKDAESLKRSTSLNNSESLKKSTSLKEIKRLKNFSNKKNRCFQDIELEYSVLNKQYLSKHGIFRFLDKLFYWAKKHKLETLLILLVCVVGVIVYFNRSLIQLRFQYESLPKREFSYSRQSPWIGLDESINNKIKSQRKFNLHKMWFSPLQTIPDVVSGKIDFGLTSTLPDAASIKEVKEQENELKTVLVGKYLIAVAVSKDLNLSDITVPELQAIYSGKKTNWQELRKNINLKIMPYRLEDKDPNSVFFKKYILWDQEFMSLKKEEVKKEEVKKVVFKTLTEAIDSLIKTDNKGAIFFGNKYAMINQYKDLIKILPLKEKKDTENDDDILKNDLFIIHKSNNKIGEYYTNFVVSQQGQCILKNTEGFVPIDSSLDCGEDQKTKEK